VTMSCQMHNQSLRSLTYLQIQIKMKIRPKSSH